MHSRSVRVKIGDNVVPTREQQEAAQKSPSPRKHWHEGLIDGHYEEDEGPKFDFNKVLRRSSPAREEERPASIKVFDKELSSPSISTHDDKPVSDSGESPEDASAKSPSKRKFRLRTIAKTVAASNRINVELRETEQQYYGKAFEIFGLGGPGFTTDKASPSLKNPYSNYKLEGAQSPGQGRKVHQDDSDDEEESAEESEEEEDFELGTFKFGVAPVIRTTSGDKKDSLSSEGYTPTTVDGIAGTQAKGLTAGEAGGSGTGDVQGSDAAGSEAAEAIKRKASGTEAERAKAEAENRAGQRQGRGREHGGSSGADKGSSPTFKGPKSGTLLASASVHDYGRSHSSSPDVDGSGRRPDSESSFHQDLIRLGSDSSVDDANRGLDGGDRLCWNCFLPIQDDWKTCEYCNADLFTKQCWNCQQPIKSSWTKCMHCDAVLVQSPRQKGIRARRSPPGSRSPRRSRKRLEEELSEEEKLKQLGVQYKLGDGQHTDTLIMVTSVHKKPEQVTRSVLSSRGSVDFLDVRSPGLRSPRSIPGRFDTPAVEFAVEAFSPPPIVPQPIRKFQVPPLNLIKAVKKSLDVMKEYEARSLLPPSTASGGVRRWPSDEMLGSPLRPQTSSFTSAFTERLPEKEKPMFNFAIRPSSVRGGFHSHAPRKGHTNLMESGDSGKDIMKHQFRVMLGINDIAAPSRSADRLLNDDKTLDKARRHLKSEGGLPPPGSASQHQSRLFGGHFPVKTADVLGSKQSSLDPMDLRPPRHAIEYGQLFSRGAATPRHARREKGLHRAESLDGENRNPRNQKGSPREESPGPQLRPNTSVKPKTRQESRGQSFRNAPRTADASLFKNAEENFAAQPLQIDPEEVKILLKKMFFQHSVNEEHHKGHENDGSPSHSQGFHHHHSTHSVTRMPLNGFLDCLSDLGVITVKAKGTAKRPSTRGGTMDAGRKSLIKRVDAAQVFKSFQNSLGTVSFSEFEACLQAIAHRTVGGKAQHSTASSENLLDSISLLNEMLGRTLDPDQLDQLSDDDLEIGGDGHPWSEEKGRRKSITKLGLVADRFPMHP